MRAVQIGQLQVSSSPGDILAAVGLGSCVALVVGGFTVRRQVVFGLAHVLLPDSAADAREGGADPAKFADRAVPSLLDELIRLGARRTTLRAGMVGGARMFQFGSGAGDIGERNAAALARALASAGVRLDDRCDVGGTTGRSVRVVLSEGRVLVRTSRSAEQQLFQLSLGPGGE